MSPRSARPHRVRYPRRDDTGEASRIIGYSKTCTCGQRSPILSSVSAARAWVRVHAATGHRH